MEPLTAVEVAVMMLTWAIYGAQQVAALLIQLHLGLTIWAVGLTISGFLLGCAFCQLWRDPNEHQNQS